MISADTKQKQALLEKVIALGDRVGNTPLHHFSAELTGNTRVKLMGKMEWMQIGGSVKARAAYSIIRDAVETGRLTENTILLDATSGNTGIAYAAIAKEVGIKVTLCMPSNASIERKQILADLGVDIIYTSPLEGTDGSQQVARELAQENPDKYFYADQYKNENNWKAHYNTTAVEILNQVPTITHFVAGMGTTGTFVGTGRRLREMDPSIKLIAFQPDSALHGLEGWKHLETAVVPKIYDPGVADEIFEVTTEESYEMVVRVYETENLLLSPSSAANVAGALKVAATIAEGTIVTILPDNADKYSEVIKKLIKK
jgi:S-sulfo-L-cysteine synthase (O-acetyl-L-serine-dependent)